MSWIRHKKPSRVRPVRGRSGRCCERLSIQSHLAYCELKLRLRTRPGQITRLRLLDHLHRYWRAGCFPENRLHASGRRPVFIDDSGTYCAVGYLMAQSGAQGLAAAINRDNRFVYIEDLDLSEHPEIRSWLLKHELSQTEAALIQPTYCCGMGMSSYSHPSNIFVLTVGVMPVFWLICFLVPLRLAITLVRKARELQHGINPIPTIRPIRWMSAIKAGLTAAIRGGINPITTAHRREEDTKPIMVSQIWNVYFSLFRKRLRRYSTSIITLNLALTASLAFTTGLLFIRELGRRAEAAKIEAIILDELDILQRIPIPLYQVLMVVLIGIVVFELIFTMKWRLLAINLRRKTHELQHDINAIATTRQHEKDAKPIEAARQTWNSDFSLFRKRLRCYAGLIIPLNLAFMTSLVYVASSAYVITYHQ